jgi:lipoprotein-anchoring transpeptidase ErfK/SrfK
MGVPSSHGCVKMRNDDVIELFDRVPLGTPVFIQEAPL